MNGRQEGRAGFACLELVGLLLSRKMVAEQNNWKFDEICMAGWFAFRSFGTLWLISEWLCQFSDRTGPTQLVVQMC